MNVKRRTTGAVARAVAVIGLLAGSLAAPAAQAQMAVIDVAAIRQLVAQVNYWRQQITGMQNQLNQLRQTHSALTGGRGMELLLPTSAAERNYLPADWAEMRRVLDGQQCSIRRVEWRRDPGDAGAGHSGRRAARVHDDGGARQRADGRGNRRRQVR